MVAAAAYLAAEAGLTEDDIVGSGEGNGGHAKEKGGGRKVSVCSEGGGGISLDGLQGGREEKAAFGRSDTARQRTKPSSKRRKKVS